MRYFIPLLFAALFAHPQGHANTPPAPAFSLWSRSAQPPTPVTGKFKLWLDSTKKLQFLDSSGVSTPVPVGGPTQGSKVLPASQSGFTNFPPKQFAFTTANAGAPGFNTAGLVTDSSTMVAAKTGLHMIVCSAQTQTNDSGAFTALYYSINDGTKVFCGAIQYATSSAYPINNGFDIVPLTAGQTIKFYGFTAVHDTIEISSFVVVPL